MNQEPSRLCHMHLHLVPLDFGSLPLQVSPALTGAGRSRHHAHESTLPFLYRVRKPGPGWLSSLLSERFSVAFLCNKESRSQTFRTLRGGRRDRLLGACGKKAAREKLSQTSLGKHTTSRGPKRGTRCVIRRRLSAPLANTIMLYSGGKRSTTQFEDCPAETG